MKTILFTGATGFLGSHITEELVNQEFRVVALKRSTSNLWRCQNIADQISWISCDNISDAEPEITKSRPEILIHTAWNGVNASERGNWLVQEKNFSFFIALLEVAKKAGIRKIISIGSQAEYGVFEGTVNEDRQCNPTTAYGAVKLCASTLLKTFAEQNKIEWYWIRIFSVYGPKEGNNWLIPAAINNLIDKKRMELTPCDQKYDYLYTKDFVSGILRIINCNNGKSGIYNLSSGTSVMIKDILSFLESKLAPQQGLLKIGALPYRPDQVMHMQGNSDRFFKTFNFRPSYSLFEGLDETVNYYMSQRKNE